MYRTRPPSRTARFYPLNVRHSTPRFPAEPAIRYVLMIGALPAVSKAKRGSPIILPFCNGVPGQRPCGISPAVLALAPREAENIGDASRTTLRLGSGRAGRSEFVDTDIGPQ